ncbi:signal peptidase I [Microcoleus sp. herbarium2]|jgi:signal peptidase I|uniref:signal peptidase I n=1 Tax=Microcoleus sp. herbarium2 TaxID=3055433 RepID=UPI002FCF119A
MTSEKNNLGTKVAENPPETWWQKAWKSGFENLQIVIIALSLAIVIRALVAEPRYIPSDSMVPTLHVGDRVVVEKISYHLQPPKTGDIVVFAPPEQLQEQGFTQDQAFIKRIIGLPGQTVAVKKGLVYLNDQPLVEKYIAEPPQYQWGPYRVPENEYFVMGDNRNNSNDSSRWGFLPKQNIIGRAVVRFWPLERIGEV